MKLKTKNPQCKSGKFHLWRDKDTHENKEKISLHCKKHIHFNPFAGVRLNNRIFIPLRYKRESQQDEPPAVSI